jgi:hypothetical protein
MGKTIIVLTFVATCVMPHQAQAAIKYKRLPYCPDGIVTKNICECHKATSGRYHFCHAGNSCDTGSGICSK